MRKVVFTIACGLVCLSITTGCATWTTDKPKSKNSMWSSMQFWKKPYQTPSKLAAIWTPDTLTMSGKPPTRGFGGRIYFYNADSKAIPVEGELVVHGYEEAKSLGKTQPGKREADKTFAFTQEQFSSHLSSSELGASYSIWIPWDGAEGMQREICLIPTFKSSDGSIVQGEPAKLVLQGRSMDPEAEQVSNHFSIQESYTPTVSGELPNPGRTMRTTTISMPGQSNRLVKNVTKSKASSVGAAAAANAGDKLYGGVAVGGGSKGLASGSSQEMTTIVNDLNSNPTAQRAYNLNANTAAYAAAMSSVTQNTQAQQVQPYNVQAPGPQTSTRQPAYSLPAGMPNMIQPGSMPTHGQGTISPAGFQNILPPQAMPNQAAAPAFPVQTGPTQSAAVQLSGAQQWQPFGQAPIPLINPNAPHYSPYQAQNSPNQVQTYSPTVPASAISQGAFQMQSAQTAGFNGYQPANAVTTAGAQSRTAPAGGQAGAPAGQQVVAPLGQPSLNQR